MNIWFKRAINGTGNKSYGGNLHINLSKITDFMYDHPSYEVIDGSLRISFKIKVDGIRVRRFVELDLQDFYKGRSIHSTLYLINLICKELSIGIDDIDYLFINFTVIECKLPHYFYSYPSSFSKLQIFKIIIKDLLGRAMRGYIKQLKIKVAGFKD